MVTSPMPDMTDATPTIEEMPEMQPSARDRVVQVAGCFKVPDYPSEVCRAADAVVLVDRSYRDGYQAALSSLSPLIEAARRVKNALECIGPLPGASDAQVRELKEATGAMMRALSTFPAPARPWRDIASAPKDGTYVLTCIAGSLIPFVASYDDDPEDPYWCSFNRAYESAYRDGRHYEPTHWQPMPTVLPAPPTIGDGSK